MEPLGAGVLMPVFARADNLTQVEELADRMDWDEIKHDCRDYRQRQA